MKARGFSLLELIIVLFIMGFSIALISPSLTRILESAEIKATAQKVSSILRNSRSEAVNRGEVYQVLFDLRSGAVNVRTIRPEEMETEETKDKKGSGRTFSIPGGIQIREMKTGSGQYPSELPAIEFYPNGGSNGSSFLLEGEDQRQYRIHVHSITGAVKIERI
jgi:general secretion pathway protein H